MSSTISKAFAALLMILLIATSLLVYYSVQQQKEIANQYIQTQEIKARLSTLEATNQELNLRLSSAEAAHLKLETQTREFKNQLAIVRVALQQSNDIQLDSSGAIITRKGSKSDGIELR